MEFFEFAKMLEPYLSDGRRTGEYIRALFLSISDPEEDGFLYCQDEATFRSYANGRRGISKPASEALGSLDRDKFVRCLEGLSADSLDSLASEMAEYDPSLTAGSVCEDVADLFIGILKDGARRKWERSPKEGSPAEEALLSNLVIEEGNRCPVCGGRLIKLQRGRQFRKCRVVATLPPDARMNYTLERDYTNALPDGCVAFRDVSEMALCNNCADNYESNPSINLYVRMARGWIFL